MNILIKSLLASIALLLAVPASAANFYFAFGSDSSDPQTVNTVDAVVFGRILGLADTGVSKATSVIIDGFTSGAFSNVPTDAAAWTVQGENSFEVLNGQITSATFSSSRAFEGSLDQLFMNVELGYARGNTNFASVGANNDLAVWNNLGFDVLVFENAAAVPEPTTWAMMLVGFGMLSASMRYRRKSTAVSFA